MGLGLITWNSRMSPRGSRLCSGSMVSSVLGFMGNAQANATMTRRTVATSASFSVRQISMHRNPLSKKSLKLLDICASFCPNFIVSLTLSKISGVWWRSIFAITVITLFQCWRKTHPRHQQWWNSVQSAYGNIWCMGGWRLTGWVWTLLWHNIRSGSSVCTSTSPIDAFLRP